MKSLDLRLTRYAALIAVLILVGACSPSPAPTNTPIPTSAPTLTSIPPTPTIPVPVSVRDLPPGQAASLYVLNATLGPSNIDIYAETTPTIVNLGFGRLSSGFRIGAGTFTIRGLPARANVNDLAFAEQPITFQQGDTMILTLAGDLRSSPVQMQTSIVTPDLSIVPAASGRATVTDKCRRGSYRDLVDQGDQDDRGQH